MTLLTLLVTNWVRSLLSPAPSTLLSPGAFPELSASMIPGHGHGATGGQGQALPMGNLDMSLESGSGFISGGWSRNQFEPVGRWVRKWDLQVKPFGVEHGVVTPGIWTPVGPQPWRHLWWCPCSSSSLGTGLWGHLEAQSSHLGELVHFTSCG